MNFNSFRKEITSNNASVKELINDIFDKDALTYLLKYDTVMGRFPEEVKLDGDILKTESQSVKLLAERDPASLPWGEFAKYKIFCQLERISRKNFFKAQF